MSVLAAFDLSGKVAVVTGGNTGLGEAFCKALADVGAHVAIAARTRARSEAVAQVIAAAGGRAMVVDVDVTQPTQVETMVARVTEQLGPIDILVNNAGLCYHRPAAEVPREEWLAVFDVNVHGLWYCAQTVGRQMIARHSGVIVNIGSISAMIVNRPQMQPAYNASKAAVHHLTKSLAAEWAPYNVRVNALAPGYVVTEINRDFFATPDAEKVIRAIPMGRVGQVEDLDGAILLLASPASRFMTGAVLLVDGGHAMSI